MDLHEPVVEYAARIEGIGASNCETFFLECSDPAQGGGHWDR